MSSDYLKPGSMLGIYGGGQLGRMLAMAARQMDYRTVTLDPDPECPAAQVSDRHIAADYADVPAVQELARLADVVTYEFENVDAAALESVSDKVEITPSVSVLRVTQDRTLEKTWLRSHDFSVADFRIAKDLNSAVEAAKAVGLPALMKTARWGYDGKGQRQIRDMDDIRPAYEELCDGTGEGTVVVEQYLDVKVEMSVICARRRDGSMANHPPFVNEHVNGILDTTLGMPDDGKNKNIELLGHLAAGVAEGLGVVGLLTVEMFACADGSVKVNELAPRPHNSGHLTIEASYTSQFEQLVRMMAGLKHGNPSLYAPAAMVNLLGDIWLDAGDEGLCWDGFAAVESAKLHLYGKKEPRRGRKMGHITAMHEDSDVAISSAQLGRLVLAGLIAPPDYDEIGDVGEWGLVKGGLKGMPDYNKIVSVLDTP